MDTREYVLEILLELEKEKTYSHVLIRSVLDKSHSLSRFRT